MDTSAWERLAAVLDKIPNSYTHVDDNSHIAILKWIFTEEEADLASRMKLRGETVEEMAERLEEDLGHLGSLLEPMAKKGQIRAWTSSTGRRYCLMPFAVGIWEEQVGRVDEEFAQLAEDYFQKGKGAGLFDTEPAIMRVIPVNKTINSELEIKPYQIAENMINESKSWGVRECICKKQQGLLGNPCSYPETVCIVLGKNENSLDEDEQTMKLSKEETLEKLREAEEAGLVHCTMNMKKGHYYICNCCTCCCQVLRGVSEAGQPHAYVKSDYIIEVDGDLCSGCETCIERCQFDALTLPEDIISVNSERCIGCGVCAITCPEGALQLVAREGGTKEPPENFMDWMTQKATSRGVDPSDLL
ncbi:MAG: 4Fe-4S binding protein [Candidatus Thorarchaeota archaeon]|nr:4Fe-4S binding protein [Candidatus Thorarchaeota archaeon]